MSYVAEHSSPKGHPFIFGTGVVVGFSKFYPYDQNDALWFILRQVHAFWN